MNKRIESLRLYMNRRIEVLWFYREDWIFLAKLSAYILMGAYFTISLSEPSEPEVKQVLSLLQYFGPVPLFFVPIAIIAIRMVIWGSLPPLGELISWFLSRLAIYSMALWLIGHGGDDLYVWMLAHPNDAATGAVAVVIVWMILGLSNRSWV